MDGEAKAGRGRLGLIDRHTFYRETGRGNSRSTPVCVSATDGEFGEMDGQGLGPRPSPDLRPARPRWRGEDRVVLVPVWQTIQGDEETTTSPKVLGLLEAKFVIADTVPSKLKVGIFKEPGKSYDAWVRYSNARNLDDRDPGGHGMAIKLLKVTGGADSTGGLQDFVLFDSPTFFVGNPMQYVEFEEASLRAYGMTASGT
jgi:hypothetical protein